MTLWEREVSHWTFAWVQENLLGRPSRITSGERLGFKVDLPTSLAILYFPEAYLTLCNLERALVIDRIVCPQPALGRRERETRKKPLSRYAYPTATHHFPMAKKQSSLHSLHRWNVVKQRASLCFRSSNSLSILEFLCTLSVNGCFLITSLGT